MGNKFDVELGSTASESQQSLGQQPLENKPQKSLVDSALNRNINLLKDILNPHDLIYPFNRRRQILWSFLASFCLFLVLLGRNFGIFRSVVRFIEFEDIYLLLFLYAYEPALSAFSLMFAKYPQSLERSQKMLVDRNQKLFAQYMRANANQHGSSSSIIVVQPKIIQRTHSDLAVIIPTHKSAGFIIKTLNACLKFVKPEHIFIIDNGNSIIPLDNTASIVKKRDSKINYHWVSLGNKTIALAVGTLAIQARFPEIEKVLIIDSDTPPEGFIPPSRAHWNQADAFVLPVRGIDSNGLKPLFVAWQDMEYQKSDFWNYFTDTFFGVYKPHGAGSIWKLNALMKIFSVKISSTRFEDEDGRLGYDAMQLNLRLRMYGLRPLDTIVPENISELWKQRVRSWDMSRHADTLKHLKRFFSLNLSHPLENLVLKVTQLSVIYNNMADWLRLPVFILLSSEESFWLKMAIFIAAEVTTNLLWNYWKLRKNPELQVDFKTIISYPLYKFLHQGLSIMGLLRAIFIYFPNAPAFFSISSLMHLGALDLKQIEQNTEKGLREMGIIIPANSRDDRPIERESLQYYRLSRHSSRVSDVELHKHSCRPVPRDDQDIPPNVHNLAETSKEIRRGVLAPSYRNYRVDERGQNRNGVTGKVLRKSVSPVVIFPGTVSEEALGQTRKKGVQELDHGKDATPKVPHSNLRRSSVP